MAGGVSRSLIHPPAFSRLDLYNRDLIFSSRAERMPWATARQGLVRPNLNPAFRI